MDPLPVIEPDDPPATCTLELHDLRSQAERYARAGAGGKLIERSPRRLAVRLRSGVDLDEVGKAVAIERDCCPFYEIAWDPAARELSFTVTRAEQEPALDAIAYALGLGAWGRPDPRRP